MANQEELQTCETMKGISCPMIRVLKALGGKWALPVMYGLTSVDGPVRFCNLHKALAPITQTELARQLRECERLGLVTRTVYAEVPPRVEYAVSELGATLREPLNGLLTWALKHEPEISARKTESSEVSAKKAESTT